jgi:probable rRNA maturation factor
MSVTLKVTQRKYAVNSSRIINVATKAKAILGYSKFACGIMIVNDQAIRKLNHQYRNIDKPTDVLGFANLQTNVPGQLPIPESEEDFDLGDLFISAPYIYKHCLTHKLDVEKHFDVIIIHGIVHLVGYDHETDEEYQQMKSVEDKLLQEINLL